MRPTEDLIIAAVIPRERLGGEGVYSLLDMVLQQNFDETYFEGVHKHLFRASVAAQVQNLPLDEEVLQSLLQQQNVPETERLTCQVTFRDLMGEHVSIEKLRVLLPSFRDAVHTDRMAGLLEEGATLLTEGMRIDGQDVKGYQATRTHLLTRMAELDAKEVKALPSKDIRVTAREILEEYEKAKAGTAPGVMTGFREIDKLTNGFQRGELAIFCGYTGEGKTFTLLNSCYHAAVHQGKNPVFCSLEMPLSQVRRRLIALHTNHPQFGIPGGLDYERIKKGILDPAEEKLFRDVVIDWETNEDYGQVQVIQMSKFDTVAVLNEKLMYQRSQHAVDTVMLDYASLMASARRRTDRRDEIVEVIEALKALALSFNEGEGLCLLTANQISRKAREEAEPLGRYGINFASETSAIEKTADFLGWILRTDALRAAREVQMGVSKYRDGSANIDFRLIEHYESSLLADLNGY